MFAIETDVSPRHRGAAVMFGAGCYGSAADFRAQRVQYAARAWMSEQEDVATDGRTLLLLCAHRLSPERREAMVRCFERVLLHAPPEEIPELAASLREGGAFVDQGLTVLSGAAEDVRAAVSAVEPFRPLPSGWSLSEVPRDASDDLIEEIQALHVASDVAPLPGWSLRGGEGRSVTFILRDAAGVLVGCTTLCLMMRPGDGDDQLGLLDAPGLSTPGALPPRAAMIVGTCLGDGARGRGLSCRLVGAALREGYERLGVRRFYALVGAGDEVAARMVARCGMQPHLAEGFVLAELPDP